MQAKRLQAARVDDFSDTVDPGQVISTDPKAGTPAPRDSTVQVHVSKGPQLVDVPDVTGMTVEDASQALQNQGLVPDVTNYRPGGTVVAQSPRGGQLKKGQTVRLFL